MFNYSNLRKKAYQLLEGEDHESKISRQVNLVLICLIFANVAAVMVESHSRIGQRYATEFALFEVISIIIFSIEYVLRVWSCIESQRFNHLPQLKARIRYMITPVALIDFIAIAPFYISLFIAIDLRYLRLLRVLRLLKLIHYFKSFNIFLTVIAKEFKSMVAAILMMIVLIIVAASLMYTLENEAQPEVFSNIPESIWWSVVTMTTVGYGDVTPVTTLGRVVAAFIMLIGVGLVALPAGMLAARFGDELRERKLSLNAHIKDALADGVIDEGEYSSLVKLAGQLELKPEDLERNIALLKKGRSGEKCPHCGKHLWSSRKPGSETD